MQLDLTADQKTFQSTARKMLDKEMPLSRIRELVDAGEPFDTAWWARGAELGWAALLAPEQLGGGGISGEGLRDLAIIAEEFGRGAVPGPIVGVNTVIDALASVVHVQGHHAETIETLMSGEAVAAWAVYEPGVDWQPQTPSTTAKPAPGGGYLLDGVKDRVEYASWSDWLLVTASAPEGVSQFLVPRSAPGVSVVPTPGIDLTRPFAEVRLDQVVVPAEALVGAIGEAGTLIERMAQVAAVLHLAETCGAVDRAFELSVQWGFDRFSFGRPLASYQALKHRWADGKAHLEACLATTEAAVAAVSARSDEAAELVSVASAYVGDHAVEIIQDAVQLFGGLAITWEHDAHFFLRKATVNKLLYGTPTDHRRALARLQIA